ncbi:outer protein P [Xanthomonas citri pv. fuscans CFBP 6996]|uniref:type III secretion system effector XopP n=1 Tax=Xanthomonas citri TaxID=346 RepID=UPI000C1A1033|nr:type III secretion system effector XopP [Xanthomonas citri]ATS50925.1 outer protein P [Xanthomonas citri pv. phaseoli var. fuscans]ATS56672.1 outer protein P [Xanthomonas citri pv. phaseoli var. fuscans]ATS59318.1 outer protein P [Xanthomonas citri pv. phaseoli var. fuscans]PTY31608.1 outer protein P [Xanthomonas citri pv. fuscans CFBP 6996]QWN15547.1 outer protein P [Xanthomonas citri]
MPRVRATNQTPVDPAQSAQPAAPPQDAATNASVPDDRVAPSAQLSGLAIRPRRTVRASRANIPGTSSANARDVRAALFGAPSVPQAPDPFEVLNNASSTLIRFNDWAQTIGRTDTKDIGALETRVGTGKSAIESARQGLQALSELKIRRRISSPDIEAHEDRLVSSLGQAAAMTYVACEQLVDQKLAQELGATLTDSSGLAQFDAQAIRLVQPEAWRALRTHLLDVIAALEEVFRRIKSPMTNRAPSDSQKSHLPLIRMTMGSCYERMQTVRGILCEIYSRRLSDQASNCGLPQVMDRLNALEEIDRSMDAEVEQALTEVTNIHVERYFSTEHSLRPEMLAMYKNVLVEYAELRGRAATQLCMDAAALIEEGGHARDRLWPTMLDLAQALTDQRQAIIDLCQFAVQDRQLIGAAAASPEQTPASITPSVPTTTAGKSSRSRKARKRTPDASSSAAVPAPQAIDARSAAQKQADEVLRAAPLESLPVAELGGDFIALARRLGKDTTDVERLIGDSRHDAATAFDFARTRMQGWFGSSERLLQLKSKLRAGDGRIEQLDTRLRLLQRIEHEFERREADALKTDPQPRAPHLERLLAMHGLARVTAPNRRPSEGDRGDRGRLFEVRIDHTPQSNGDIPAPWFVHVHTEQPVTPAGLRALHYRDLAAVHLKTAREVNLGPRWEEMMRALGNTEAKVHRATIGSKLLGQLWALGSGGQQ